MQGRLHQHAHLHQADVQLRQILTIYMLCSAMQCSAAWKACKGFHYYHVVHCLYVCIHSQRKGFERKRNAPLHTCSCTLACTSQKAGIFISCFGFQMPVYSYIHCIYLREAGSLPDCNHPQNIACQSGRRQSCTAPKQAIAEPQHVDPGKCCPVCTQSSSSA